MRIDSIAVYRFRFPLIRPYRLSFGPLHHFDTIYVETRSADGETGLGEATPLPGYGHETAESCWRDACGIARGLVSRDTGEVDGACAALAAESPFAATAVNTAAEMLEGHPLLRSIGAVPLVATINEDGGEPLEREVEAAVGAGFRTLKVKVGWNVPRDLEHVAEVRRLAVGRARLRLDANQGYGRDDAVAFVRELDPDGIELVEQTCAAGDWESAQAVKAAAEVPIMLDESIGGPADIDRAARLRAADLIKLKLMKAGGLSRLQAQLGRIRDRGMVPVLGNGVATDLGCWQEACVAVGGIDNAGEMNGFRKIDSSPAAAPIRPADGGMEIVPGRASLDVARLREWLIESVEFG